MFSIDVRTGATNQPIMMIAELKGMTISFPPAPILILRTYKQIQNNILQINVILE